MKKDIHPTYYSDAQVTCSCGNIFTVGSTMQEISTELCSKCHPFFTGKQKLVDTAGRVERFRAKSKKAAALKDEKVKRERKRRDRVIESRDEQQKHDEKATAGAK